MNQDIQQHHALQLQLQITPHFKILRFKRLNKTLVCSLRLLYKRNTLNRLLPALVLIS